MASWLLRLVTIVCCASNIGTAIGAQNHPSRVSTYSQRHEVLSKQSQAGSVTEILEKAVHALGGQTALESIKTVSSHALIYRTFSLGESRMPGVADTAVSSTGEQTISYDLRHVSTVLQRTDRNNAIGDYWTFYRPHLGGVDASIVVKSGSDGFACFNKGNMYLFGEYNATAGYTDAYYAGVLVRDAWRLSPGLLLTMQASKRTLTAFNVDINNVGSHPAIHDWSTNLTVIFDPNTYLPSRVRAYEDHQIFGPSTSDYLLYNYTELNRVQFPRNIKLLYNEDLMLQEILVDSIDLNPQFPAGFFEGLPESAINETLFGLSPASPRTSELYNTAEVWESSQNLLWSGPFPGTLPALKVIKPIPSLENLYHLTFENDVSYRTVVAIFDDAVMITDAPAHQSKLIIQYVRETFNRSVTHLLVTHHHHDHNYGASDYIAVGAKLVVPQDFRYYWQKIPGVQFATANETHPFIHRDSKMQVRGVWHEVDAHSADWMYFTFTEACPGSDSPMGVVTADAWSPGIYPWDYGQQPVIQWLSMARADHVPRANLALPIHGDPTNSTELYASIGYEYPDYKTSDFLPGGPWC